MLREMPLNVRRRPGRPGVDRSKHPLLGVPANSVEPLMTVNKPASHSQRVISKKRAALLAGCAATVLLTVTACGGGGTSGTTNKDGFAQAAQNNGALTVWVDATRMDA